MYDDNEDGLILENVLPLEEGSAIDWDAVLRDFAWAHSLSEEEEHERELAVQNDPILQLAR